MAITPTVAAIIAAGGVERYAVAEGIDPGAMCRAVHRLRAVYDFEFWCISCVKIFDKTSGRLVPFKLRWAQLKLGCGDYFGSVGSRNSAAGRCFGIGE